MYFPIWALENWGQGCHGAGSRVKGTGLPRSRHSSIGDRVIKEQALEYRGQGYQGAGYRVVGTGWSLKSRLSSIGHGCHGVGTQV